ncbi:hypothetical protein [Brevundimonas sp.]|uniref:hypothetical protein n=1 Tax=Brevundimonas sp. TaxID=1871086 RepID=UPI0035691FFF
MKNDEPPPIDDLALSEREAQWRKVPGGLRLAQRNLRDQIGLYRIRYRGEVAVVGVATDKKGGLAKRFSDFTRPSPSGRNHHAGRLIYEHRNEVELEVLITGDRHSSPDDAKRLKAPMIELHKPIWTAPARSPATFERRPKSRTKAIKPGTKMSPYTGTIPGQSGRLPDRDE